MASVKFARLEEVSDGTFNVDGVEIFRTGHWKNRDWTVEDLQTMEESFQALKAEVEPGVKLGHVQSIEGGVAAPRFGTVVNMYRKGEALLADFIHVPATVAGLIKKKAYPRVSVEMWNKFRDSAGTVYRNVIDAVALLGSDLPEVTTLEDVMALYGREATPELVAFDREDREVEMIEFEIETEWEGLEIDSSEFQYALYERIKGVPEKFGILTDAVEQEEIEQEVRELQWKAQSLVMEILQGEGDFAGLSTDEKKARIGGILDELETEISTLAGNFQQSRTGTEPGVEQMSEEHKDELSRLKAERDEFEKKAQEAEDREKATKDKLATFQAQKVESEAKSGAKDFFDSIGDKVLPAERLVAEPLLAFALASEGTDTPLQFQKDDKAVGVADGIKALFELRNDLPDELFQQMLDTEDPEKLRKKDGGSSAELIAKAEQYQKDNDGVDYTTALKFVRRENPELAKAADAEVVPMFDPNSDDNDES